ncbi:MAG: heavy metal translocating P-type ATPase [Chitinophagales bacterium]|nr:heavy metal translocating P-type ATPase [Chitinophagales bacterium]
MSNEIKLILPLAISSSDSILNQIEPVLKPLKSVIHVKVDEQLLQLHLILQDNSNVNEVLQILSKMGVDVEVTQRNFPILEMSCASCAGSVEDILRVTPGVLEVQVNYASQKGLVKYLPDVVQPEQLKKAVQDGGYDLFIEDTDDRLDELKENRLLSSRNELIGAWLLAFPLFMIGMFFMNIPYANLIMWVLATPLVFYFGRQFYIGAWKQLKHRTSNMDTLVALSTGIAYVFSVFNMIFPEFWEMRGLHGHVYFEASGVIIAFILLGRYLEEHAKNRAASSIKKLIGLQPKTVHSILPSGEVIEMQIVNVSVGDILLAKPGEKIAVDGTVTQGSSYIDESMISGEAHPVKKEVGNTVYAGTINQKGSFQYQAQKVGAETVLARIIRMVELAQGSKAPVQKLVDKIASIFVPSVILIALVAFGIWVIFGGEHVLSHGFMAFVTVLVIACPCALGLATPTALMVGIGKGAENGILIKDAESLEIAHQLNVVVLDKTGTITEGHPSVQDIFWNDQEDLSFNQSILYSIEQSSEHPLAQAIVNFFKSNQNFISDIEIENITGQGIRGKYKAQNFYIGNDRLMASHGVLVSDKVQSWLMQQYQYSHTIVYFFDEQHLIAVISIADKIKGSSQQAIATLHDMDIQVAMLTGDQQQTAESVAQQVNIDVVKSQVLPEEKYDFVKNLQSQGKIVAMVGDGVNDSSALAQADISIAMGHGSDVAMEVAKVTIISSDLQKIPIAIQLSRLTVKTIRQNLFWAFIYNVIGIPIAAGVFYPINGFMLDPMWAGAAMALSSVSVVINSLRLKAKAIH